jgi:hypothetical protein
MAHRPGLRLRVAAATEGAWSRGQQSQSKTVARPLDVFRDDPAKDQAMHLRPWEPSGPKWSQDRAKKTLASLAKAAKKSAQSVR